MATWKQILTEADLGAMADGNTNIVTANVLYDWLDTNPFNYITEAGDITSVEAGIGLSGGATSGPVTLDLDFSELEDMTGSVASDDELIIQRNTDQVECRKAVSEINLATFSNSLNWAPDQDIWRVIDINDTNSGFTWGTGNITAPSSASILKVVAGTGITLESDSTLNAIKIESHASPDTFKTVTIADPSGTGTWAANGSVTASGVDDTITLEEGPSGLIQIERETGAPSEGRIRFDFSGDIDKFKTMTCVSNDTNYTWDDTIIVANSSTGGVSFVAGDGIELLADATNDAIRITNDAALDTEAIQDIVGAMVTGNTENNISVTYDDSGGKLNFSTDPDEDTTYTVSSESGGEIRLTGSNSTTDSIYISGGTNMDVSETGDTITLGYDGSNIQIASDNGSAGGLTPDEGQLQIYSYDSSQDVFQQGSQVKMFFSGDGSSIETPSNGDILSEISTWNGKTSSGGWHKISNITTEFVALTGSDGSTANGHSRMSFTADDGDHSHPSMVIDGASGTIFYGREAVMDATPQSPSYELGFTAAHPVASFVNRSGGAVSDGQCVVDFMTHANAENGPLLNFFSSNTDTATDFLGMTGNGHVAMMLDAYGVANGTNARRIGMQYFKQVGAGDLGTGLAGLWMVSVGKAAADNTFHVMTFDENGALTVPGDLIVGGTTTSVNSTTFTVDDPNIELAFGTADDSPTAASGAGFTVDVHPGSGGASYRPSFKWETGPTSTWLGTMGEWRLNSYAHTSASCIWQGSVGTGEPGDLDEVPEGGLWFDTSGEKLYVKTAD